MPSHPFGVRRLVGLFAATTFLTALALPATGAPVATAQEANNGIAWLYDANGKNVGVATFAESSDGVRLRVWAQGLPAGFHGMHVHAVGLCEGPAFTTAGGHFNPANKQHGLKNPLGAHAGDLPQLEVAANGVARYQTSTKSLSLSGGPASVFNPDGTALVIHADMDDEMTDPTGNSGARIACGVIQRAPASALLGELLGLGAGLAGPR
jgi:Cu-Zn family superoxide dismutase